MITGGAGFIGSALIRYLMSHTSNKIINVDKLTYAGHLSSLESIAQDDRYTFEKVDICNIEEVRHLFLTHQPDIIMHLAAESHVDRSILGPQAFIETNIVGTYTLLETARAYWQSLLPQQQKDFRFHHISTDEVFGTLHPSDPSFTESTPYSPNSPYSASKASSDHLVRAWHKTYHLPILITNCSNNYGPYQFPEKLIPLIISSALAGKPLPLYGDGLQVRDWLYVDDHVHALYCVVENGTVGETYNIGGHQEKTNLAVVHAICDLLEEMVPQKPQGVSYYRDLIRYVKDRPGHDQRYAINASKIQNELNWTPAESFESGLRKTVQWYIDHQSWMKQLTTEKKALKEMAEIE